MSNFRTADGILGIGLLGVIALGGVVLSGVKEVKRELKDLREKKWTQGGGGTNTPLKVRGGAMTVFTTANGAKSQDVGWQATDASGLNWCTSVDTSYIGRDRLFYNGNQVDTPLQQPLAFPWTITIYGTTPGRQKALQLKSQNVRCSGDSGTSVLMTFIGGSKPYNSDLPNGGAYYGNKRYCDNGCSGQAEESCERMSAVDIKLDDQPVQNYTCPDGECSVLVGAPPP